MAGKPKILTLNLRSISFLPLCGALAAFYFGWGIASVILLVVFASLLLISVRYKIGSVGLDRRVLGLNFYQYVLLIKLADSLPETKKNIRVFTFGLFLLAHNGKMRAGFLKRNQLLAKV